MSKKRVFFLTSDALSVYQWRHRRVLEPLVFSADEAGLTQFSRYLDQAPPLPAYLLVDLVDEEFRPETIPHVFGSDRRALLRNRRVRLFRHARFANAVFQGRDVAGRRDDQVLFTALTRPGLVTPWLEQISRSKVALAGITSVPILSRSLQKRITGDSDQALLVTLHSRAGLRQTYFRKRHLKVSRLSVTPRVDADRYASYILAEVEKTSRYLSSLRLTSARRPLDVYVLSHGGVLADLERQVTDTIATRHHLINISDIASKVGVKGKLGTAYADDLFAHLLMRESPRNYYAPPEDIRYYRLSRAREGLFAASILLLLGGIGWSGFAFLEGVIAKQETVAFDRQIEFYEERIRRANERLAPLPVNPDDIRNAVDAVNRLIEYKSSPLDMMAVLSQELASHANLQIDQFDWESIRNRESAVGARTSSGEASTNKSEGYYQIARVRGHVAPFDGNFRAAVEQVNRFVEALARIDSVQDVKVIEAPLNLSSQQRLAGTAGVGAVEDTANFDLRVVLRTHHERG